MSSLEESLILKRKITKQDITEFVKIISSKCNLRINEITFENEDAEASFDFKNNNFNLNYQMIDSSLIDSNVFNIEIIITIFHELTHAVQKTQVFDSETYKKLPSYYVILISNYFSIINEKNFYCKNHNDFMVEYNAIICSYINTIELLKKHNLDYSLIEEKLKDYKKNHFPFEFNINKEMINQIYTAKMRDDILFKYRYALHNYGKEKNLTHQECEIYGYKK